MVRILVADDHELIRSSLRELLELREGWRVCAEAADGTEAVARAVEHRPDVAILDLRMPGLDGLEAARRIRTSSPATEVLMVTGFGSDEVLTEALACGVQGLALKGQGAAEIVEAVEALANHRPFFGAGVPRPAETPPRARPALRRSRLSPRECEVARLLAMGKTNWAVAVILGISVKTVETHRAAIFDKLGLESVVELVHYAIRTFLIEI